MELNKKIKKQYNTIYIQHFWTIDRRPITSIHAGFDLFSFFQLSKMGYYMHITVEISIQKDLYHSQLFYL